MKPFRERAAWRPSADAGGNPRDGTLLYVEDDPQNRLVLSQRLGGRYTILMASDDRQACDLLRDHHDKISCVLMDIQLQGSTLSGLALTRLFRGLGVDTPVPPYARELPLTKAPIIFLTAYGGHFSDRELAATGGTYLFSKPVVFDALLQVLAQIQLRQLRSGFLRA